MPRALLAARHILLTGAVGGRERSHNNTKSPDTFGTFDRKTSSGTTGDDIDRRTPRSGACDGRSFFVFEDM